MKARLFEMFVLVLLVWVVYLHISAWLELIA